MALFELILNTMYLDQKQVNRFNYICDGTPIGVSTSFALVSALGLITDDTDNFPTGLLGARLQAILNSQTIFVQALARNVYDPLDFYDYAYVAGIVGGVAGGGASPVDTIGFNSNRVRTDIRRGQKRFGGLSLTAIGNGGAIAGATLTAAPAMAEALGTTYSYTAGGNALDFAPVVVSKEKVVVDGKATYVYYPTLSAQSAHWASGLTWIMKTSTRTQGSRQYGRGQ